MQLKHEQQEKKIALRMCWGDLRDLWLAERATVREQ
jgi:hypothetical protein